MPKHLVIQSDNTTVVAYLNRQGGTHSRSLDVLTRRIVTWCMTHQLTLCAFHVAGADNCLADQLSRPGERVRRDLTKTSEWALDQSVADKLFRLWTTPQVDLFATEQNRKVATFCSRIPSPLALPTAAMALQWSPGLFYLYPPISLVLQSLAKIRREEAEAIAVLPWWPTRGWFPLVLEMVCDLPVLLPRNRTILLSPEGESHPSLQSLHLAGWRLSGNLFRQTEFLRQLPQLLQAPLDPPRRLYTSRNGNPIFAGVKNGISIPFMCLPD